ncbi:TAXI family TRAP transporter solute-binding subunit [Halorarum salinum]|uniref:TRAP transporter substrate-binding protein n=1 Tax=Halorarum salinum TaxID=2743089 RepID=A0A7D5LAC4_9EURY|nr:TAXI family TRAP transporter solute-binding subunit [Halobaculum salinum]QLG61730.1 TRAP transporter substrate-binding protein [Halobaculum salinum]
MGGGDGNGDGNGGGNGDGNGGGNGDGNGGGNGGGNGDDVVEMRVGSSTEGSTVFQTSQAFQRVLREHSDSVRWNTQTTGGDPPSIRIYDEGDLEAYGLTNYIVRKGMNGEDPFQEEMEVPYQCFSYFVRDDFFVAVDGSGIETTDDMLGKNVYLLQPGWGTRAMFMEVMDEDPELKEQLTENVVNIDTSDVAGAVEEGRIDAILGYGANEVNLPSWFAEVDARADLHTVEVSDSFKNVFESSPLVPYYEKDSYGFNQDVGGQIQGYQILFQYYVSPDVPNEAVYEMLQVAHDEYESVQEGQPAFFPYGENPEYFVNALEGEGLPPVHPGAADFYEEVGVWRDDLERGE